VTSRFIIALMCLVLASCATTGNNEPESEPEVVAAAQEDLPKGSGESIDNQWYLITSGPGSSIALPCPIAMTMSPHAGGPTGMQTIRRTWRVL